MRRLPAVFGLPVFLAATLLATALPAAAEGTAYASWSFDDGTVTVPVTGFPDGALTTDASAAQVFSGGTTFLGPGTPFGAMFGSSQGKPYAYIRPAPRNRPSTTTITFAAPVPANSWGFALGDVDADTVTVSATTEGGVPLTADQLGWRSAFNYCAVTPKPSSCGVDPGVFVPTWDAASSTLRGNGLDTSGSAGWFVPTVPVTSVTFTFSVLSGNPIYQVWLASLTRTVSGAVTGDCAGTPATGTVRLLNPAGIEIANTTTDGDYTFDTVVPDDYQVQIVPADGFVVTGEDTLPADVTSGDRAGVDFQLTCPPPTTTDSPPAVTTTPDPTTTTSETTTPPAPQPGRPPAQPLAETGSNLGAWIGIGGLLLALGSGLRFTLRRRSAH